MIVVPEHLWTCMLDEFAREPQLVEQVCYLDGVADPVGSAAAVATTLTLPRARLCPGRFEVPAEAMSEAGKHLRRHRLRRLVQVHTHPSLWTGHSPWDDAHAYSQLPGAVSVVLPNFARGAPSLADAGVHVRTADGWCQLAADEVPHHLRIVPSLLDFRTVEKNEVKQQQPRIEPPRKRPWWTVLAFWRR